MTFPAAQLVTLVKRTSSGRDADGNRTYTNTFTQAQGGFAPSGSSEQTQSQDQVTEQPAVYFPPPAPDLTSIDAIVVNPVIEAGEIIAGDWYEIDGSVKPWTWQSSGVSAGVVAPLKRTAG